MTNNYYRSHAKEFAESTVNADVSSLYHDFLALIPAGGRILDLGCGSGRDLRYFQQSGYLATGIDNSPELAAYAEKLSGSEVICMDMRNINWTEHFDGIWACASLLHLTEREIIEILPKLERALISGGILYCSFKYGTFSGERNGRYFTDMNEERMTELIKQCGRLTILAARITGDVRPERSGELWLNILLKR